MMCSYSYSKENKAYIKRHSQKELPIEVVDRICSYNIGPEPVYFSTLEKDEYSGIVENIYGAKRLQKGLFIQKLMVLPLLPLAPALLRNCYYCSYGMNKGFRSYGYTGSGSGYLDYMEDFDIAEDFDYDRIDRIEMFDISDMVALDPEFKYCGYQKGHGIHAIKYMLLYKMYPVCEMLMKLGIDRMYSDKALREITDNKDFRQYLARNHEACKNMAFQTAFNAFKKNKCANPGDYASSLADRIACGKQSAFRNKKAYSHILKYITQERLAKYITENNINKESYGDYITACEWLKLDLSDTKVLLPKNFKEVHDNYTKQYSDWKTEEEKRKAKIAGAVVSQKMEEVAEQFAFLGSFSSEGYCVLVAHSKAELIDEGSALNHCVGRMDYDKRQARGESVICFIRKVEDRTTPYVTAEVKINDTGLRVSQCYGFKDNIVPEVQGFVDSWMKESNKAYRRKTA